MGQSHNTTVLSGLHNCFLAIGKCAEKYPDKAKSFVTRVMFLTHSIYQLFYEFPSTVPWWNASGWNKVHYRTCTRDVNIYHSTWKISLPFSGPVSLLSRWSTLKVRGKLNSPRNHDGELPPQEKQQRTPVHLFQRHRKGPLGNLCRTTPGTTGQREKWDTSSQWSFSFSCTSPFLGELVPLHLPLQRGGVRWWQCFGLCTRTINGAVGCWIFGNKLIFNSYFLSQTTSCPAFYIVCLFFPVQHLPTVL